MSAIRHHLDTAAVARLLRDPAGGVARDLLRRGKRVESRAKTLVGVDSGRLRASITATLVTVNGNPACRIGTNVEYALAHHNGTGLYGPSGQRIRPRRGRLLVFTPRGAARPVFARSVAGSRPNPFLKDALDAASD
jgi:phage gpG-like protein